MILPPEEASANRNVLVIDVLGFMGSCPKRLGDAFGGDNPCP